MCNKCLIKCKISSKLKELAQKSDRQLRLTEEQEMGDKDIVTVKEEELDDDEEEKLLQLEGHSLAPDEVHIESEAQQPIQGIPQQKQPPQNLTGAEVSPQIIPQGPSLNIMEEGFSLSNTVRYN